MGFSWIRFGRSEVLHLECGLDPRDLWDQVWEPNFVTVCGCVDKLQCTKHIVKVTGSLLTRVEDCRLRVTGHLLF